MDRIQKIVGREILNARGNPTVEAEILTESGICAVASVPSGTSKGKYEAKELYDGGNRYGGRGTKKAAEHVSTEISREICGMEVTDQVGIDAVLCSLDGTEDKSRLGSNAILAVSVAAARAGAKSEGVPLYKYLAEKVEGHQGEVHKRSIQLPDIIATVIAGGVFSDSGLEFEDYMAVFHGFNSFSDQLEALWSLRWNLEKGLRAVYGTFPEDGGALAPPLKSSEEAFAWIMKTAQEIGYKKHISLGLDVAASELWIEKEGVYRLKKVGKKEEFTTERLLKYYKELTSLYPITLIEDGFSQDDFNMFSKMTEEMQGLQIVGDDLFATNVNRLSYGIQCRAANAILLKINQIGTVTEAMNAAALAEKHGYEVIVSLRSGETTDDFIADLAVAVGARQIKLGSPVRAERNAKYNRLLRIEEELNKEKMS
jgi:enolase